MNAKRLFNKTKPFVYAKLALGAAMIAVLVLLLALLMGVGWLFGDTGMLIGLLLWTGCVGAVRTPTDPSPSAKRWAHIFARLGSRSTSPIATFPLKRPPGLSAAYRHKNPIRRAC